MVSVSDDWIKGVLVQAAVTAYHQQEGLRNTPLFLTVSEAEKSKIRVSARKVLF